MFKMRKKVAMLLFVVFMNLLFSGFATAEENYKLVKRNPISDQFDILIPENFTALSVGNIKGFFIDAPSCAYTNESNDINIGFRLKDYAVNSKNTLEVYQKSYKDSFASSKVTKLLSSNIKNVNGTKVLVMECISTTFQGSFYSMVYCTEMNEKLLLCSFNCNEAKTEELKPLAKKILDSLDIKYNMVSKLVKKTITQKMWRLTLIPEKSSNSIMANVSKITQPLNNRIKYFDTTNVGLSYSNASNDISINFSTKVGKKLTINDFKDIGKINNVVISKYTKKTVKGKTVITPIGSPVLDNSMVANGKTNNKDGKFAAVFFIGSKNKSKIDSNLAAAKNSQLALFSDNKFVKFISLKDYKLEVDYLYIYGSNAKDVEITAKAFDEGRLPFKLKAAKLTSEISKSNTYETVYEKVKKK